MSNPFKGCSELMRRFGLMGYGDFNSEMRSGLPERPNRKPPAAIAGDGPRYDTQREPRLPAWGMNVAYASLVPSQQSNKGSISGIQRVGGVWEPQPGPEQIKMFRRMLNRGIPCETGGVGVIVSPDGTIPGR